MPELPPKTITLLLGGARSGKSRIALKLAERADRVAFIATATRSDAEMEAKIDRHREDRPKEWLTVEEPVELAAELEKCGSRHDLVVVDCLTLFTANLLAAKKENQVAIDARMETLLAALHAVPSSIVLVSNEVGSGIVPMHPLGRRFRDLLGEINQRIASIADNVVLMVSGLPLILKGELPGVRL